jgi:chemotaxis protein CheD
MTALHHGQRDRIADFQVAAERRTIYLHPGQIVCVAEPALITTVLGSCVAVCLWDEGTNVAGINHFLLPALPVNAVNDDRYGNTAMEHLIEAVMVLGGSVSRLTAKIFGGANVLMPLHSRKSIGTQNAEVAREILSKHGIAITADETGGQRGRKLHFDTATGRVSIKVLA